MITRDEYERCLAGYTILGCAVRSREALGFVLRRSGDDRESELKKRLVPFLRFKEPGKQWSATTLTGFDGIVVGCSPRPRPQLVAVSARGEAHVTGSGESFREVIPPYLEGGPDRGSVTRLRTIGGHLYMCGHGRSVGRREGRESWLSFTQLIPSATADEGFSDIDGTSEDDLYAAGGRGDVWRYDGLAWTQCRYPSDAWISALCRASDGDIYVGEIYGSVVRGRGDRWSLIHEGELPMPFTAMVAFEGRVWCSNDYGLWVIENGRVREADVPPEVKGCAGHLSARDGALLVAGHGGAALYEEGEWQVVFHSVDSNPPGSH